jgi:glycosyltransferase involved in cell wall biosynthesis
MSIRPAGRAVEGNSRSHARVQTRREPYDPRVFPAMLESPPSPRTIALCITELDAGGAERALAMLATRLDRERFRPIVYCLGPSPAPGPTATPASIRGGAVASLAPWLESAGVEVHCLGARGAGDVLRTVGKLTALFRDHQPALVQTFLFHANLLGRLAAGRAGVSRVVCGIRVAERRKRWHLWLDRLTQRMVDRYVCVSRSVADFSATAGRLPPEKLTVIPNGVDPSEANAAPADLQPLGIPPQTPTVVSIGRLDFQKGLDWLLKTCPRWLSDCKEWHLLLVGSGPEEGRLRALAQASGLDARIHFAGWRGDVAGILAASQALLLPSRWEGMPNVVLQAMASGLPVLATDVEGVEELLGPDAPPQTASFGDTAGWAGKLRHLLCDASLRRRLGDRNRARASAEFSVGRMVDRYQSLWSELL